MKAIHRRIQKIESIVNYKPDPVRIMLRIRDHQDSDVVGINGIMRLPNETLDELFNRAAGDENVYIGMCEYRNGGIK